MNFQKIGVIGSGNWGIALGVAFARNRHRVTIWTRSEEKAQLLNHSRSHPVIAPQVFPEGLTFTTSPIEVMAASVIVSALPSQVTLPVWKESFVSLLLNQTLIHSTKGLLPDGTPYISERLSDLTRSQWSFLTGPTFADEVALQLPAAMVLAVPRFTDEYSSLRGMLSSDYLRIYLSDDLIGTQICSAVKNILAIASGALDELGLGHNARAALMTRGLAEMTRLVRSAGGKQETAYGLAGMGDLLLTSTGPQSRNRRLGRELVRTGSLEKAQMTLNGEVAEGQFATEIALKLALTHDLQMPITEAVQQLLSGCKPEEVIKTLLARPAGLES
ncbi:MAG: NAD(P)H-dependent glycerol-3-phosphate dehydrogenase [Holophagaceae bacterium]